MTISTAPSLSPAGRGCIPSSSAIPATAAAGPARSCAALSPRAGRAGPRQDAAAEGAVAMVGRSWPVRSGPCLAGGHPPVRPGTHPPVLQADPGLDHPQAAPPEQADRWTWLVLAASPQLRLARQL